ncbi:tyrosine aminotransferase [Lycorma delicatula]|uniref:tyrosine aminotransferase n=1 Tax=Lycorma delicatula TaxID=130591 RepID=UPI003F519F58
MSSRNQWDLHRSVWASSTHNPIRSLVENLHMEPNPNKKFLALSIGDPTIFGNFHTSSVVVDALTESVQSMKYDGYANSIGHESARDAVAKYSSTDNLKYTADDIILTNGCSAAIENCIICLANPGQNILIPKPGFSIYKTLAESLGIHVRYYNLLPDKCWEIDLENLKEQIDEDTVAILVNNPSNPCGSVYNKEHLKAILDVARSYFLPVISDEIYEYMVFRSEKFIPMALVADDIPVLTCSGLTKRFLVPGWRVGWIKIHDPVGVLKEIRTGLTALSQKTLGCNTLAQGALPKILTETPETFFIKTINALERHACTAYSILSEAKGLTPIMPQGAMYMMVSIDFENLPSFQTDIQFIEQMVKEESVFCLPGLCFNYPGYIRLVLTLPEDSLIEACQRIIEFCNRYYINQSEKQQN